MIPKDFLFTSRLINFLNNPRLVMENASLKVDLMLLNLTVEMLEISKSSTYRIINNNEPPFWYM